MKKKVIVKSQERVLVSTEIAIFSWVFFGFFFLTAPALKHFAPLKNEFTHPTYDIAVQRLNMKGKVFNVFSLWTLHKQRS